MSKRREAAPTYGAASFFVLRRLPGRRSYFCVLTVVLADSSVVAGAALCFTVVALASVTTGFFAIAACVAGLVALSSFTVLVAPLTAFVLPLCIELTL